LTSEGGFERNRLIATVALRRRAFVRMATWKVAHTDCYVQQLIFFSDDHLTGLLSSGPGGSYVAGDGRDHPLSEQEMQSLRALAERMLMETDPDKLQTLIEQLRRIVETRLSNPA
jgi:hypothetical protein